MPTDRPRIAITETDEVVRALDIAGRHWPAEAGSRSKLLLRLVEVGERAIEEADRRTVDERRQLIATQAGAGRGMYSADILAELREDWPE